MLLHISTSTQKRSMRKQSSGFTLVELVLVMVIVGILAVVALPRFFQRQTFDARAFSDRIMSVVSYAQKTAIAQRRPVFVRLDGASAAACFDAACTNIVRAPTGAAGAAAAACGGDASWLCVATPAGLSYASGVSNFYFNALGRPFNATDTEPTSSFNARLDITVTGDGATRTIYVQSETGYVHR